ncbi:hypothetical protein C5746_42890 [Streptomyces atratus]|uniref:Uncharacterized protein n=1 Tax=Streptomyces atratus TaxID=1893 RepID=A0A2Z5JSN1_STRAR|nr:hypothetical protein C5746_00345 [Streptomyces atratus]AXE82465.1 hypothetical protein C5746_42890 [Streptomyces atratus]
MYTADGVSASTSVPAPMAPMESGSAALRPLLSPYRPTTMALSGRATTGTLEASPPVRPCSAPSG